MTSPEPSPLMTLSRRKAALTRCHGADDERTQAADSALRILKAAIALDGLTDEERAELDALRDRNDGLLRLLAQN